MRSKILRVEVDREDGDTVTIETSDGVTVEVVSRSVWRSVAGDGDDGASVIEAGPWVVVVSRH